MRERMVDFIRDKLSTEFRLIEGGTTYLLFNVNNLSLFNLDHFTYKVFSKILEGDKIEDILESDQIPVFESICTKLFKNGVDKFTDDCPTTSKSMLDRLVLNVSNECNLNCCYCYAKGGNYGHEKSSMEEHVAIKTVDYFYNIYDEVNNIQFFGGEPLLNPEIIQTVCTHILSKYNKNEILKMPDFSIVTNGTIISPEILEMLHTNNIQVTVSIDGPQFIHDPLRGHGTFNKIIKTIEHLKNKNINVGIECTFTKFHLINEFDVTDLMEFFYTRLELHATHIPCVATSENNDLYIDENDLTKSYTRAIKFALDSLSTNDYKLDSYTLRLLRALVYKKPIETYCPAGATTLSVSSEGDIYPCFMFTGNDKFLIGNVFDNKISPTKLLNVSETLKSISKQNDPKCQSCWARSLCFGCIGNDYMLSGSVKTKSRCEFNKNLIEFFLLNSGESLKDPIVISRIASLSEPFENNLDNLNSDF